VIYFIGEGPGGHVKIGYCADPRGGFTHEDVARSRMASLQTGNPRRLVLLGFTTSGTMDDERALHAQFARSRLEGEWFSRTRDLELLIEAHALDAVVHALAPRAPSIPVAPRSARRPAVRLGRPRTPKDPWARSSPARAPIPDEEEHREPIPFGFPAHSGLPRWAGYKRRVG
jgi:hypothetical protein